MSPRSAVHSTFVIERRFSAPVERVFAAWADAEKKRRWFACHDDWSTVEYQLDFRVDGTERNVVLTDAGVEHRFAARFFDIVANQRIVYAYDMFVGDVRFSVSLVTVVFERTLAATTVTFTEQVVFLDGHGDGDERREGTEVGLDRLVADVCSTAG